MDFLTVTLPLPHKLLSPNARTRNYAWKARVVRDARTIARLETLARLGVARPLWPAATVRIQWFTKTVRHPDRDNALASLKAAFDGITDAGLLANDRGLYPEPVQFAKDAHDPRVEITVERRAA